MRHINYFNGEILNLGKLEDLFEDCFQNIIDDFRLHYNIIEYQERYSPSLDNSLYRAYSKTNSGEFKYRNVYIVEIISKEHYDAIENDEYYSEKSIVDPTKLDELEIEVNKNITRFNKMCKIYNMDYNINLNNENWKYCDIIELKLRKTT
jgi:hypothetical protein